MDFVVLGTKQARESGIKPCSWLHIGNCFSFVGEKGENNIPELPYLSQNGIREDVKTQLWSTGTSKPVGQCTHFLDHPIMIAVGWQEGAVILAMG